MADKVTYLGARNLSKLNKRNICITIKFQTLPPLFFFGNRSHSEQPGHHSWPVWISFRLDLGPVPRAFSLLLPVGMGMNVVEDEVGFGPMVGIRAATNM